MMGCDIHIWAEKKSGDVWGEVSIGALLDDRNYGAFGFLADVRNYSAVPPIADRRGLPDDASLEAIDFLDGRHSVSWLALDELLAFDYDAIVEDRRVTAKLSSGITSGACTCEKGWGKKMPWREFLGQSFVDDVLEMKRLGVERIIFGFDS